MVTFVLTTYALVTFVHISNISAVTGPILTKLFGPNFFGVIIFVDQNVLGQNFFKTQNFIRAQSFQTRDFIGPEKNFELKFPSYPKLSQTNNFFKPQIFEPNFSLTFFLDQNFLDPQFILALNFFFFKFFFNPNFFSRSKIFLVQKFLDQTFYWVQKKCWTKIFSDQNFFRPKFFGTKFFVKNFFLTQIFFPS